jgi:dihydrolipoamide dehydrogenase
MMDKYDLIVIGAGPGGYVAAVRAAELGLKTAIVEKDQLGGVCLNYGCIPSKSLLKNAEVVRTLRTESDVYGIKNKDFEADFGAAVDRSRKVSKRLNQGVNFLMKKNKVAIFEGSASFLDKNSIEVELRDGEKLTLKADHFIVATGTQAVELKAFPFDGERILNYEQAITNKAPISPIVIVGGGAVGVEFATVWRGYGYEVTIVEMLDHLVPNEDPEASAALEKAFRKQGIKVLTSTALEKIEKKKDYIDVTIRTEKGEETFQAGQALIAVGFRAVPNTLNLQAAGVETDKKGWIVTDGFGKTSNESVYAVGDVTGKMLLAHAASAMGRIAVEKIAGLNPEPFNNDLIPHTTFSYPQVAAFGVSEKEAEKRNIQVGIGKALFLSNGKALGMGDHDGWVKLIFNKKDDQLIGAVLVGAEVAELLPELTLAATKKLTAADLLSNVHTHPTLGEVVLEAVEAYTLSKESGK